MDKNPLQSKKFLAYIIADLGWKVALLYMLTHLQSKLDYYSFFVIVSLIIVSGFIQVGYILGQAALDKYLKVAENINPNDKRNNKN